MSSMNAIELYPVGSVILEDQSIFQIGLPNSKRNRFFFLGGGGRGFWILTFHGRVQKNIQRTFLGKNRFEVFPHFLGNQCPMNLSASHILMVLNLCQGTESSDGTLFFPWGGGGGGIVIGKKIVCMRKNAEINCLPHRCIWKKIVCRDHLRYARFEEFKKNCLHSRSGGKNLQALN